jgi:hypothetical protein
VATVQKHPEWRVIVELMREAPYGSMFSHAEIAASCGLSVCSPRYFRQVAQARKVLLNDWQRETETVRGQGYRLVEPPQFFGRARRWLTLAGKRVRRAAKTLVAAPQHMLTDEQNMRNADALAKIGALESQRRRVLTETRPSLPPPKKPDVPPLLSA